MEIINKITQKIAGVEKSRDAELNSEVRDMLKQYAYYEEDADTCYRYQECADCEKLKEEFKLFGITIKDMTPVCGECGCNLILKIPMEVMECPLGRW